MVTDGPRYTLLLMECVGAADGCGSSAMTPTLLDMKSLAGPFFMHVMQVHVNGTFGTGQLIASPDRSELVQMFRAPDDTMFELRHVETRSVDEKQSQSFRRSGDEWEPQRTYTWKRVRP